MAAVVTPPPPPAAAAAAAAVDAVYDELLFSRDDAMMASSFADINSSNFCCLKEYPPPYWCADLTPQVAITRLQGLCMYALRKEADARRRIKQLRVIHGDASPVCSSNDGEVNALTATADFFRGQAVLARAARKWMMSLVLVQQ